MKKIVALLAIGIVVLSGLGAVAHDDSKATEIVEVKGGIGQLTVVVENTGEDPVDDVILIISMDGGVFGTIDVTETSTIDTLNVDDTTTETIGASNPFIGFGNVKLSVYVQYAKTWTGTAFVFGPFIVGVQQCG